MSPQGRYANDTETVTTSAQTTAKNAANGIARDSTIVPGADPTERRVEMRRNHMKTDRRMYTDCLTRAAVTLGTTGKDTLDATVLAIESRADGISRALRIAALFAITAGLVLLVPAFDAYAQDGGGSIDPNAGADQIFDVIGQLSLIAGVVMAIGSLVARKVMAAMGFALAGGLIWAFCSSPEGTIGGAANWVIDAFTGGGN